MKIILSMCPYSISCTEYKFNNLPIPPTEKYRSNVEYRFEVKDEREFGEELDLFVTLKNDFEEKLDSEFVCYIYLSDGELYLDKSILDKLSKINAVLEWK